MPDELTPGHAHIEPELAGKVSGRPSHRHAVAVGIEAEHGGAPTAGVKQIEEQPDGGRLAGAVGTDEPEYLALPDFEVEVLDAQPKTVSLGQSFGLYG